MMMGKVSNYSKETDRRHFLKTVAALTAMAYLPAFIPKTARADQWGGLLPTRRLGKTGLDVSMFCIGGGPYDYNVGSEERILETALEGGCRFFETARSYSRGESEQAFGSVLEPYRKDIILSTKSRATDAESVKRELEESLKSLKTDYLDIYLLHNMASIEDVDNRINNGVYEVFLEAKAQGIVKHIGFSGHTHFEINNYLLDKDLPDMEVMLLPVNAIDPAYNSFILNTLPKAVDKNIGVMAMKALGGGGMTGADVAWGRGGRGTKRDRVIPDVISMKEAQQYVYSMPVATVTYGCTTAEQVKEDIEYVKNFSKMSNTEQSALVEKVASMNQDGVLEHYKS
ncbi:MAG TPA: aldo/keto reductase [Draconibacterium sp.]|nr:aldo/keto reductase [Draconibacterium sp.]